MDNLAVQFGYTADQLQSLVSAGFDLIDAGNLEGAASVFQGLLLLTPGDARLHAALGSVYHAQEKLTEAEQAYETALQINPKTPLALLNRGALRCSRGDMGGLKDILAAQSAPSLQRRAQALLARFSPCA